MSGKNAYVTILLDNTYLPGSLALANSIKKTNSKIPIILIISSNLSNKIKFFLKNDLNCKKLFNEIIEISSKNDLILTKLNDLNILNNYLKRSDLLSTLSKLLIWKLLIHYDTVIYLDSDTLILNNIDNLFETYKKITEYDIVAASDIGWPDCFNSGVFIFKPSIKIFNELINFYNNDQISSFDGADQGLLNEFFNLSSIKNLIYNTNSIIKTNGNWIRLPIIYNIQQTNNYEYLPSLFRFKNDLKILHFIGKFNKPWLKNYETKNNSLFKFKDNKNFYSIWWESFTSSLNDFNQIQKILQFSGLLPDVEDYQKEQQKKDVELKQQQQEQQQKQQQQQEEQHQEQEKIVENKQDNQIYNFYYKKPEYEITNVTDQGEAWRLHESKFVNEWNKQEEKEAQKTIDTSNNHPQVVDEVQQRINEFDEYISNNPIFPWEKYANRQKATRVFPSYTSPVTDYNNNTDNNDDDEKLHKNIPFEIGFDSGYELEQFLENQKLQKQIQNDDDRDKELNSFTNPVVINTHDDHDHHSHSEDEDRDKEEEINALKDDVDIQTQLELESDINEYTNDERIEDFEYTDIRGNIDDEDEERERVEEEIQRLADELADELET
ncbi:hypothetical protein B5S32_g535 [[Candida] boidinii]|nr:hypothetical protein B5S29_g365 [[Candida] boidinii]OWB76384.1 hypothetical protein B5S32_g535 [[Candida] boidinii]